MTWTIEPHGKGYALYSGRDDMHHGMNLVYLSEPDANWEKTKALIEAAPDLLEACENANVLLAKLAMDGSITQVAWSAVQFQLRTAIKKARGEK